MTDCYYCTGLGVDDCYVDPKWLIVKVVAQKGCNDRWDAVID